MNKQELIADLEQRVQELNEEINAISPDPEMNSDLDFEVGYNAGMSCAIQLIKELLNG